MTKHRSITLTEPQLEFLKLEAEQLGISISDVVRRIVDQHRTRERWLKIMQPTDLDKAETFVRPFWKKFCEEVGIDPELAVEWKRPEDAIRRANEDTTPSILQMPFHTQSPEMQASIIESGKILFYDHSVAIRNGTTWSLEHPRFDGNDGEAGEYCKIWNVNNKDKTK